MVAKSKSPEVEVPAESRREFGLDGSRRVEQRTDERGRVLIRRTQTGEQEDVQLWRSEVDKLSPRVYFSCRRKETPVNIAQFGIGRFGRNHARVWQQFGVELAVVDPFVDPASADGIRLIDAETALEWADAVDIVTPADSHFELAARALEAGLNTFVEKPLALDARQAGELMRRADYNGLVLQPGHIYRFHPATAALRDLVTGGRLGKLQYAFGHFTGFKRMREDVGVGLTDGIHFTDLCLYLFDEMPSSVDAFAADIVGRGLTDVATITMTFSSGYAQIEAGYFSPHTCRDFTLIGTDATATVDFAASELRLHHNRFVRSGRAVQAESGPVETVSVEADEPLKAELEDFVQAVTTGARPRCDAAAAVNVLRVLDAAAESAANHQAIVIPAAAIAA